VRRVREYADVIAGIARRRVRRTVEFLRSRITATIEHGRNNAFGGSGTSFLIQDHVSPRVRRDPSFDMPSHVVYVVHGRFSPFASSGGCCCDPITGMHMLGRSLLRP